MNEAKCGNCTSFDDGICLVSTDEMDCSHTACKNYIGILENQCLQFSCPCREVCVTNYNK